MTSQNENIAMSNYCFIVTKRETDCISFVDFFLRVKILYTSLER